MTASSKEQSIFSLALATIGSIALSMVGAELIIPASDWVFRQGYSKSVTYALGMATLLTLSLTICGPLLVCLRTVSAALHVREPKRVQILHRILASFASLTLAFAGIYYHIACLGDYRDAEHKLREYAMVKIYPQLADLRIADYERSFDGIENRLFVGVEELAMEQRSKYRKARGIVALPIKDLQEAARKSKVFSPIYNPDDRIPLFVDCLSFSISNMTTVGFSGISATTFEARIIASFQALSAFLIVAVSLNSYFTLRDEESPLLRRS